MSTWIDISASWIYRILFISFFLPAKWQTFILIAFSVFVVTASVLTTIKPTAKELMIACLLGSGYLFYLAWYPATPTAQRPELISFLERKVSILILPFIFLFYSKLTTRSWKPQLPWFVLGACITTLLSNALILRDAISHHNLASMNHVQYRIAFEHCSHIHPTYFGMFVCFAVGVLWVYDHEYFATRRWLSYLIQIILFLSLIFLLPKAALFALLLLFIYSIRYVFSMANTTKLYLSLGLFFAVCMLYFTFTVIQQRVDEVLFFVTNSNPDLNNSVDMRKLILTEDLILLKKHWLRGLGPTNLQIQLNLLFFLSSYFAAQPLGNYNTHNEYLNQWLSFGVAGIIIFIIVLVWHYKKAMQQKNTIYLFLMIILTTTFFTENVLSRQHGIIFYALFTSMFFFMQDTFLLPSERLEYEKEQT